MPKSFRRPVRRSTSLIRIAHGSGAPTRTPTGCCGSTCRSRLCENARRVSVRLKNDQKRRSLAHSEASPFATLLQVSRTDAIFESARKFLHGLEGHGSLRYSQEELDEIADPLNTRPRKTLDWRTPLEIYAEVLKKSVADPSTPPSIAFRLELETAVLKGALKAVVLYFNSLYCLPFFEI